MTFPVCPNCGAPGMQRFYEAADLPVHSCMMLDSREAALAFPRRDLILGLCRACGFVSNVAFDPGAQRYASGYEEQQSFSPRFCAFQTDLIERLIDRYDIRRRDVVEIGCGKGDFLIELCERGGNRGVGIDPACDPQRMNDRTNGRVRFVADLYSERYSDLPCDLLCCRHTLEHIHPTYDFVRMVRNVVGDREDIRVFFEVPAVERVLRECAFWDIYYEHCSYFSLGSLAHVFRANRFEIDELGYDFDDQYLLIVARPAAQPTRPVFAAEDDAERIAADVEQFCAQVQATMAGWNERIRTLKAQGKRIAVWGSGSKCVSFLSAIDDAEAIDAVVDINPHRHGKYLAGSGMRVDAPDALRTVRPDLVIAMNPIYREEIGHDLASMELEPELATV